MDLAFEHMMSTVPVCDSRRVLPLALDRFYKPLGVCNIVERQAPLGIRDFLQST